MNTENKNSSAIKTIVLSAIIVLVGVSAFLVGMLAQLEKGEKLPRPSISETTSSTALSDLSPENYQLLLEFAKEYDLTLRDWPDNMLALLEKNPEAKEFVLQYPLKKDLEPKIDISADLNGREVPLFLQWDQRWGYKEYGNSVMGISGCGPTCLSMVCSYLLDDPKYTPAYVADFAVENDYCVPGSGSAWTLISEGGKRLGIDVVEIPLDEDRIIRNLEVGNPIICIMGPGDFTDDGHFIVMTGYADGKIKINDPNSPLRSEKLWDFEEIESQIRNLWVCRNIPTE